jgi:signal transduction histidine kinase
MSQFKPSAQSESVPWRTDAEDLQQAKMAALGKLTAGLMHELHNPGTAAKRASSQLRENMLRLQQLSLRFSSQPRTQPQLDCMRRLLERALLRSPALAMSSVEQSDAEETMAVWLAASGVENAYAIAPALVAIGFEPSELECAQMAFQSTGFSDTLNWLEALVTSASLVSAVEESIARIADLAQSVKEFVHDERTASQEIDVHASLQSTLTLLGHKLHLKQIKVNKCFSATPPTLRACGPALSQVWTNLLDNAIDASPEGGVIEIATRIEGDPAQGDSADTRCIAVSITDAGTGIAAENLPHIFDAFYTSKPQGAGTGLGLEIVHRIITRKLGGAIEVESQPGRTSFVVYLPQRG